jgi:hypothetical protein
VPITNNSEWQLIAAPLSGDSLLVREQAGVVIALLPPATPVYDIERLPLGEPDDDDRRLEGLVPVDQGNTWRRAVWYGGGDDLSYAAPHEIATVTVSQAADELDDCWLVWLQQETERALARIIGSMQPLGRRVMDEDHARGLQMDAERLGRQAEEAFPSRAWARWRGGPPEGRRFRLRRPGATEPFDPAQLLQVADPRHEAQPAWIDLEIPLHLMPEEVDRDASVSLDPGAQRSRLQRLRH